MGCCFSKELDNSKNEKMSLLGKSVEEEPSENGISRTLTSILETVESEELQLAQKTICGAAAVQDATESVKSPSHRRLGVANGDHVLRSIYDGPFNLHPLNEIKRVLNRYGTLQENDLMEAGVGGKRLTEDSSRSAPCANSAGSSCIHANHENGSTTARQLWCSLENNFTPCVPVALGQGFREQKSLSKSRLKEDSVTAKCSLLQDGIEAAAGNRSVIAPRKGDGEITASPLAYLDIDRHQISTRDKEFYSICVVDEDDLRMDVEGQATVDTETDTDGESSAVEETYSITQPVGNGKQFLVQESTVDVSAPTGTSYNPVADSLVEPKNGMEVKTSSDLVNGGHGLHASGITADVLRAQAYVEELPQNSTWETDIPSSSVGMNEFVSERNNSPAPVPLTQDVQRPQQLKGTIRVGSSLGGSGNSYGSEDLQFHLHENHTAEQGENCSEQLSDLNYLGSGFDKETSFLFASQGNAEYRSEGNQHRSEDRQGSKGNTDEFGAVSCCSKNPSNFCGRCSDPEQLLKCEDVGALETSCRCEEQAENTNSLLSGPPDLIFKGETSNFLEFTSDEDGVCPQTLEHNQPSQIDTSTSEISSLRGVFRENRDILTFLEPQNINGHEKIQAENCLEVQFLHKIAKNDCETRGFSSSLNEDSSCSASLTHFETSEMDWNGEQSTLWEKCAFHRLEDHQSARSDPLYSRVGTEEARNQMKCEMQCEDKMGSGIKPRSEASIVYDQCALNSSGDLTCKCGVFPEAQETSAVPAGTSDVLQGQSESDRVSASVQENDSKAVEMDTGCNMTFTESGEKPTELCKSGSLPHTPEPSKMEPPCPVRHPDSELLPHYAEIFKENTKDSASGSLVKAQAEHACVTSTETSQICSLKTSEASSGICVDPGQVDKYAATPSYEIPLVSDRESERGHAKCVLDLMEDILQESDSASKMDPRDSQDVGDLGTVNQFSPSAPLRHLFSDNGFDNDQEYLMGYLWINSSLNKPDKTCSTSEALQNQAEDVTVSSFGIGGFPYQLLVQQNSDIWGWQDTDEECVSTATWIHESCFFKTRFKVWRFCCVQLIFFFKSHLGLIGGSWQMKPSPFLQVSSVL